MLFLLRCLKLANNDIYLTPTDVNIRNIPMQNELVSDVSESPWHLTLFHGNIVLLAISHRYGICGHSSWHPG